MRHESSSPEGLSSHTVVDVHRSEPRDGPSREGDRLSESASVTERRGTPVNRVHVVGARSGTTLMLELLANGFAVDGYSRKEQSVLDVPNPLFPRASTTPRTGEIPGSRGCCCAVIPGAGSSSWREIRET